MKEKCVAYLGGRCIRCGYKRCVNALEFHHRDPTTKRFAIAGGAYTRRWEAVKAELEKCDLICANCHREIHEQQLEAKRRTFLHADTPAA